MTEAISIAIAACGCLMLVILYARIRAASAGMRLKQHRSRDAGLADLLNYAAMVDDGVIVGKNGSFTAAWIYRGGDNASSTEQQRELVSFRINQALSGLGSGWMIHVDAVRRPAPGYAAAGQSHFPDPVSAAIDEERRRLFEGLGTMHEGYFVFSATYLPPLLAQSRFVELMFDDEAATPGHKARTQGLIDFFRRECASIESRLSSAVALERLRGKEVIGEDGSCATHDALLRWLQFCITGINHPVILPRNPMYLDAVIGGQELFGGVVPRIGRKFVQAVAIEGFPLESTPGILTALGELACEYRWSSRFIFMDTHEAVSHLDKFRKKWRQKIRGFFDQVFNTSTGPVDQDALSMVADAEAAIAEVNSGLVAQGYYTSVVILMDEDRERLDAAARQVEKAINRTGFAARVESVNTMDAYLGSLPGHGVENVRRPLINTMNLADLLPTSTIWTGLDKAPCPLYPPLAPALMHCVTHGDTRSDRAWAMEWIDTILSLNNVETTPAQRNEIGNAIMSMHASGAKTLSEFALTIQDEAVRQAIRPYTVEGSMGHLLDAEEDGLSLSDFTVFEIEELMGMGEKYALPTLLYLFRRIERSLQGQPAAIILDEAWLALGHPAFRARIRIWLKVLAKANCLVLMATQSLSDAANSGILDVLVESTATKIFLPNVYARDEDTAALYRRMGLNARQIEILATAIPKRQYYYVSEHGRRLYDLALGPLAMAFVGATDKESVAAVKALEAKHGSAWTSAWLASRGLNLDDYGGAA
ncbi:conjugal transfer protein TrbE [Janthinobacterium sp. HLX7-2]|uniref:VirB4 family type IV secretion/conjugal transfer ATPase n=1 Tax=Janthinobacterium sp. HLX7-2 TaxID=1259331 RepID=UPI003F24AE1D